MPMTMFMRGCVRRDPIELASCTIFIEHFGGRVWARFEYGCDFSLKFTLSACRHDEKGGARR